MKNAIYHCFSLSDDKSPRNYEIANPSSRQGIFPIIDRSESYLQLVYKPLIEFDECGPVC